MHADQVADEMVLPTMMTQDEQILDQKSNELRILRKAFRHGCIDRVVQSVYPG